jgi:DNA-binding response OmpR family regulator
MAADLLIVDDDEDTVEALAELLEAEGHSVRVARDGVEGLAALDVRFADAVLLDRALLERAPASRGRGTVVASQPVDAGH